MQDLMEILKLIACLPFLLYACRSDLASRRVSNRVWKLMLSALFLFVLYEAWNGGVTYIQQLSFSFIFTFVLTYLLFRLNVFGGADAKALIVLSFLIPIYPELRIHTHVFPIFGVPFHGLFAFTVFENALLLTAAVPLGILCYNLLHYTPEMRKNPLYMLIAYRVNIAGLKYLIEKGSHVRLVERFELEDGQLRSRFTGNGITLDSCILSRLEAHTKKGTLGSCFWISPTIPFILPITLGFINSIFIGDLVFFLIMGIS